MGSTSDGHAHNGSVALPRRHRNRASGGFLLESLAKTSLVRAIASESKQDRKGKRKSENLEPATPQRGSSATYEPGNNGNGYPSSSELLNSFGNGASSSAASPSLSGSRGTSIQQNGRPVSSSTSNASHVGFDTDPAQIVEMALRLSEARRQQASLRRNVSADISSRNVVNGRSPSAATNPAATYHTEGSPLMKHLSSSMTAEGGGAMLQQRFTESSPVPTFSQHISTSTFEISKATLSRVEKAKTYIELAYEHRRLLPHLPPIRRPGIQPPPGTTFPSNKEYNPVQYARNRKLRLREKSGLAPELDGWHDVSRVRAWVDAAINSHTETQHDPEECVRLPPFSQHNDDEKEKDQNLRESPQSKQHNRQRRPRSDWTTHPADLLADAYWLEQGLNKTKIQDRNNHAIYPPETRFNFAGWGQRATSSTVPQSLQQKNTPGNEPEPRSTQRSPRSSAPVLPKFQSSRQKSDTSQLFNKPRQLKRSLVSDAKDTTRRALEIFEKSFESDSSSDTSSSDSDTEEQQRGRRDNSSKDHRFDLPDGDPFLVSGDSLGQIHQSPDSDVDGHRWPSRTGRLRSSVDEARASNSINRRSVRNSTASDLERRNDRQTLPGKNGASRNASRESTAQGSLSSVSPITKPGIPSIAINDSPTGSRSSSPAKRGRGLISSLRGKHHNDSRAGIDTTDFAKSHISSHSRDPSTDVDASRNGSGNDSRGTSPLNTQRRRSTSFDRQKRASPSTHGSISRTSTKSSMPNIEHHSRIRGMFKGGRIAEIVGTEVSKVGDYIWKREPPTEHWPSTSSDYGAPSYKTSDSEDEDRHDEDIRTTRAGNGRGSQSSASSYAGPRTSSDKPGDRPQYYHSHLPSFTSPFQRDRDKQDNQREAKTPGSAGKEDEDHISVQLEQHRSRSRSPRLDRLAPPKLDTSGSQNQPSDRKGIGEFADLAKPRSASQAYNDAINRGSDHARSSTTFSPYASGSTPALIVPEKPHRVSKNDLLRIETLLLISTVKANGILYAQTDALTKDGSAPINSSIPQSIHLRQSDEHIRDARQLITKITEHSNTFKERLHTFSKTTVANLHDELQRLEDSIDNTLTPKVRAAADNAGELSMKLTTTSTLAVKGLNDTISEAFRFRKRGPFRWLRSLGYATIEWMVVGLLWLIWAVVTIIRIFLGTIKCGTRSVRWLLWID